MKEVLKIEPRDLTESIIEMAYSVIEAGFVKKTKKFRGPGGAEGAEAAAEGEGAAAAAGAEGGEEKAEGEPAAEGTANGEEGAEAKTEGNV